MRDEGIESEACKCHGTGSVGCRNHDDDADHIPAKRDVFEEESSPQQRSLFHRPLLVSLVVDRNSRRRGVVMSGAVLTHTDCSLPCPTGLLILSCILLLGCGNGSAGHFLKGF